MPINSKDVVWIEEPEIGFWESTFLPAIAKGLKTTLGHITQYKPVTQQYPEQRPELPQHYRGVHRLNRDEQGRVKCVACMLCATACPANCIAIEAAPAPPDWPDRDKFPAEFVLDELRCIYCGMCEEACPVDAIELTHIYDLTGETSRRFGVQQGEAARDLRPDEGQPEGPGADRPRPVGARVGVRAAAHRGPGDAGGARRPRGRRLDARRHRPAAARAEENVIFRGNYSAAAICRRSAG